MNKDIPPQLDYRKITLNLAKLLGSVEHFILGVEELLKFDHHQPEDDSKLQHHGRKIIALTEVASKTLTRAGVGLYLFVVCPPPFLPLKSGYFRLLCMIRRHRSAFSSELDDRITRLLLPLHTNMVIRSGGIDPRAQLGIEELLVVPPAVRWHKPAPQPDVASVLMPPPDAFEKRQQDRINRLAEIRKRSMEMASPRRPRVPKQYPAGKPGDAEAPSRSRRVLTRTNTQHFGIFCTGKKES